jgi:uncharacterized membrane protein YhaH (DUF805 family)
MEWYWWVLIAVAVVVVGYLKLKIFNSIMAKRKKAEQEIED